MIGLDWENERYVRAYVRDSEEYLMLPWQAQGLYWAIRRKVDRAGLLAARNGVDSVALLIRWPREVVDEFLPSLVAAGFVVEDRRGYLLPEFLPSEEAKQSNAQRSRESRARRAEVAAVFGAREARDEQPDPRVADATERADEQRVLATLPDEVGSSRVAMQRSVPAPAQNVTGSTLRTVPSVPSVPESARADRVETDRSARWAAARRVFALMEQERRAIDPDARATAQTHAEDQIFKLLGMGHSEDDLAHVVRVYAAEARALPDDKLRWFNTATIWEPKNVERAKSRKVGGPAARPIAAAGADDYRYSAEAAKR